MKEAIMPYMKESKWIDIDIYPWGGDYRPKTLAKIYRDDAGINIRMRSYENEIRAEMTERNSEIYTDSCMEFFFNATPEDTAAYMNFEVNPKGIMYIGFSPTGHRNGTGPIPAPENDYFSMEADIKESYWEISYRVPYEFIKKHFASFDINKAKYIKANFYKCGDMTKYPHYAVWNMIENDIPNYHLPQFFGKIIIE